MGRLVDESAEVVENGRRQRCDAIMLRGMRKRGTRFSQGGVMSCLSILGEGGVMLGCANPIYLTSEMDYSRGAKVIFEVLEADASQLKRLLGKMEHLALDSQHPPFSATLTSLEPCKTTIHALAVFKTPVMRGILTVHGKINSERED